MLAVADLGAAFLASLSPALLDGGISAQLVWSLVFLPAWIGVAKLLGLYDYDSRSLRHVTSDELPRLVLWALIGTSLLSLFLEIALGSWLDASSAVLVGAVAALSGLVLRATARRFWRLLTPPERVAIVGALPARQRILRTLELFSDLHMVSVQERDDLGVPDRDGEWLRAVDRLILAPSSLDEGQAREAVLVSRARRLALTIVPPWQGVVGAASHLEHVAELPLLVYGTSDPARSTLFLKRLVDLVLGVVALALLWPLFFVVAAAIKLDSRGPAFFRQQRVGRAQKPFTILKFRTMVADADAQKTEIAHLNRHAGVDSRMFKADDDPRVTRVGRILRRFSLDELPQLINVLRGDMSLVGPRPLIPEEDQFVPEWARLRSSIAPGITGPWQANGASMLPFSAMIELDYEYVTSLSLRRDLRLILRTIPALFGRRSS